MLLVIIYIACIVLGIVSMIGIGNSISDKDKQGIIIWSFILIFAAVISIFGFTHRVSENEQTINSYKLIALQDDKKEDVSGIRTIFTIRVEKKDVPVYRFYYQNKKGEINFVEKSVYDVSIIYTDSTPCYEVIKTQEKIEDCLFGIKSSYYPQDATYTYKLYLPEGSIASDITIDMQ